MKPLEYFFKQDEIDFRSDFHQQLLPQQRMRATASDVAQNLSRDPFEWFFFDCDVTFRFK